MYFAMEGTKHEKVVLVVLAYIIGFTAGFICFSFASSSADYDPDSTSVERITMNDEPHIPIAGEPTETIPATAPVPDAVATATYENGKLRAFVDKDEYLLSFNTSVVEAPVSDEFKTQGSHTDIPAFAVAPEGRFIYYCEQLATDDSCNNLIYDVTANVIRKITVAGEALVSNANDAKSAVWSNGALVIGNHTSQTPTEPWILQTK